ncbi:CC0125/CC1285 family lipoprotein [Shewanella livingstonensis]|uniref:Lipoprotein n=1 Tax=Shewanella livingstonensis TaxID=150120 RepID=A0A3G8LR86_9GAMM|nr:hypothetical protein [Shewanella livingstonensis]AZG71954.1 hypothetical protein EGC82_03770 [Shewanella livingstonensis]
MGNVTVSVMMLLVIILCGCNSTKAQYTQADGYRYIDRKITDNYFMLSIFSKDKAHINAYALARAASLTNKQGYDWYIIVEQKKQLTTKPSFEKTIEIRMGKGVKP